ncbi:MAG: PQQ-binding-like beta-propeller repeat protein [Planctomycetota bacterium]
MTARRHHLFYDLSLIAILVAFVFLCHSSYGQTTSSNSESNWAQWRGPFGTGAALDSANPPLEWNESTNIRWKKELPGLGHSTPIVWGNRIYVTTAIPVGEEMEPRYSGAPGAHDNLPVTQEHEFVVIAIDRKTGNIEWKKTVARKLPHEGAHYTGSLASASSATDGQRIYAYFGSYGLYCLDTNGKLVWEKDLGKMNTKHGHGEGSSPYLFGDSLAVNWDHEADSFIVVLDKRTGKERWRQVRDEVTSWSSPIVVEHQGVAQLIVAGTKAVRSYDLKNGEVIWECGGLSANVVATPVAADGMVYVGSSYDTKAMMGIRLAGAEGDITDTDNVVWSRRQRTPYVPSPLLYQGDLYFLAHYQGILSRVTGATGDEPTPPMRLNGIRNTYASPVAAKGHLMITSLEGVTLVVTAGKIPRIVSINRLDDSFGASAAIVDDSIILRGRKYLYCIGKPQ